MSDALLESALDLTSRGFRVFPLKPGDYRPAVKDWQALATTDEAMIRKVWGNGTAYNIGVCGGGGLLLVDVDRKNGKDGLVSLNDLGVELSGLVVETPTGGFHGYYRGTDVSNAPGRVGVGIDIRSKGGYVVGPGSVLDERAKQNGGTKDPGIYRIVRDDPLVDVPLAIFQRLVAPTEKAADMAPAVQPDRPDAIERAIAYLATAPLAVEGENGDETTFAVAARLKDFGVSRERAIDLMAEHWNDRCSPPWDIDGLKLKAGNAYEYGTSPLGISHPSVDFAGVKPVVDFNGRGDATDLASDHRRIQWEWADEERRAAREWLLKDYFPSVGVGLIYGVAKCGKSFLAIDLAACAVTGTPWLGLRLRGENLGALLLLGEGSGTIGLRLEAFRQQHGLAGRLNIAKARVGNLANQKGRRELGALVAEVEGEMSARGLRLALVVVDTFASSMGVEDENASPQVTQAMQVLEDLSLRHKLFVAVVAHAGKSDVGPRGSSAFSASVDIVAKVARDEGPFGQRSARRIVSVTANRNGPEDFERCFELLQVEVRRDEDGEAETSCVVRSSPMRAPELSAGDQEVRDAIEAAMIAHGEAVPGEGRAVEIATVRKVLMQKSGQSQDSARMAVKRALPKFLAARQFREFKHGNRHFIAATIAQDFAGVNTDGLFG